MKTAKWFFHVDRREISYIRYTLESYDGMAVVRTAGAFEGRIEITVAPGCEPEIAALLSSLREKEGLRMKPVEAPRDPEFA